MERLQKVIANLGYCSRREAEKLINLGKVSVNGDKITKLGTKVNYTDEIKINEEIINKDIHYEYYLLNKPRNTISSSKDEKGRKTVVDLIDTKERIYPIGRLDYDTTGIILLTNDGDFANHLMHPHNEIVKTYLAKIEGILDKDAINKLKKGVMVDDHLVKINDFKVRKKDNIKKISFVEISIIEGKNHIVKNIFQSLGYNVIKLTRTKYGFLTLDKLNSGDYRPLTIKEVKRFYQ